MRVRAACVLLATAIPGLLFAPVFGLRALVVPIAVVVLACYAAFELGEHLTALRPWRSVLALVIGALALAEVELGPGIPGQAMLRALTNGVTESWRLTLQSTWPVRPEAALIIFVPLAVLLAAVLGMELLRWPAIAVLPSVAVLGLSQAFVAATGPTATVAGLGYAAVASGVFLTHKRIMVMVPTVVLGVAAAVAVTAVDQGRQPALSLRQSQFTPFQLPRTVSPLAELAARLEQPDVPVFSYSSDSQVDRWRLVVLDNFNGVSWTAVDRYRTLGAGLEPAVAVPTTAHSAQLTVPAGNSSWIPSQAMPAAVTGAAPLIDPASGMLLLPDHTGPVDYGLRWWEPEVDSKALTGAALDPDAAAGGGLGVIPPGIAELARTATGGIRPSFESALVLERFLSQNYHVATGTELPTGSGWPQLRDFLLTTKRGTSEQFAASYVALARIVGIPARLAVGFRAPRTQNGVVHNGDALAWPEVAVTGVGWVPLDPTGGASGAGAAPTRLAQVTAQARADLPPAQDLHDPPLPGPSAGTHDGGGAVTIPIKQILLGLLALILLLVIGIPAAKLIRTARRRSRGGVAGVVAAWWEARDLLRAHGTRVSPGMTVRDVAGANTTSSIVDGLQWLASQLDIALWSGSGADDGTVVEAWAAVRDIRRGLAGRPFIARIRAVFDPRTLL
jgi:hypothetical protein